jgi:hypothetical protein
VAIPRVRPALRRPESRRPLHQDDVPRRRYRYFPFRIAPQSAYSQLLPVPWRLVKKSTTIITIVIIGSSKPWTHPSSPVCFAPREPIGSRHNDPTGHRGRVERARYPDRERKRRVGSGGGRADVEKSFSDQFCTDAVASARADLTMRLSTVRLRGPDHRGSLMVSSKAQVLRTRRCDGVA